LVEKLNVQICPLCLPMPGKALVKCFVKAKMAFYKIVYSFFGPLPDTFPQSEVHKSVASIAREAVDLKQLSDWGG
jgi:hypothetical protein